MKRFHTICVFMEKRELNNKVSKIIFHLYNKKEIYNVTVFEITIRARTLQ